MTDVFEKHLNPQQLEAVKHIDGPLLVVAGAGSGKTRVITYRMAYLICQGIPASRILGLTFTNKAADEMRDRVQSLVNAAPLVSTFHSFGARILRSEIHHLGYTRHFVIYDDDDSLRAVKEALEALKAKKDFLSPKQIQVAISNQKNEVALDRSIPYQKSGYQRQLTVVSQAYHEILRRNNAVDFDDLLILPLRLFEDHSAILEQYQDRCHYLLVDEYQDTNAPQYRLIKMLCRKHRNICAVGDPDQSIYRWRGSDIRNILNFQKDFPGTRKIVLEQNYRSTTLILGAANSLIRHNRCRTTKNLWSELGEGKEISYLPAEDHDEEAGFVTEVAQHLVKEGELKYRDIAVFYRTHAQSRAIEEALLAEDIPYVVIGGPGFYGRKEIKDILAYLRILISPADTISLLRVVNVPKRGIGNVTLDRLAAASHAKRIPLYEAVQKADSIKSLAPSVRKTLSSFAKTIEEFREKTESLPPNKLAEELINRIGYFDMLKKEFPESADDRIDNLWELMDTMQSFCEGNPGTGLRDFLDRVSLISDIDSLGDEGDKVNLMTVHNSKGLEFEAVIIVGLEEGIFPHINSLEDSERLEEERRLCYVGMTRARRFLYVTSAESRLRHGLFEHNEPSRFISEMLEGEEKHGEDAAEPTVQPRKRGRKVERKTEGLATDDLSEGDKVIHPTFGGGTVVAVERHYRETFVRILFDGDSEARLLSPAHTQLRKA
jgi:DNA helicase-2/ATP-dependent DNA helicase PcrA